MKKKYIIGGGISGLVFQFYHPEYVIITPDVGGLFRNAYLAIIHDTSETRRFLTDLGYENVDKLAKKSYIGYYHGGWIKEILSPELNLLVIQKKMAEWNKPIDLEFRPDTFDMSTSKSVNYFKTLNVDPGEVVEKLKAKSGDILEGKVTHIDDETITYQDLDGTEHILQYDSIISTVAAPIFWKLYGKEKEFSFTPITNIISDYRPNLFNDKFDSVYYDDSVPYSRITHLTKEYAIEVTGNMSDEEIKQHFPNILVKSIVRVPYGRISKSLDNSPPNRNITFLGRFAKWEYGITLEHVIKDVLEFKGVDEAG